MRVIDGIIYGMDRYEPLKIEQKWQKIWEKEEAFKALEEEGVICGYHTMIDWSKTNIEKVNALIEVKVTPQRGTGFDRIADRISRFEEVDSIYLMSGGYDFMVIVNGKSMKEVSSFVFNKLATIEYVQSTATHFVLKKYKDHGIQIQDMPVDKRTNVLL